MFAHRIQIGSLPVSVHGLRDAAAGAAGRKAAWLIALLLSFANVGFLSLLVFVMDKPKIWNEVVWALLGLPMTLVVAEPVLGIVSLFIPERRRLGLTLLLGTLLSLILGVLAAGGLCLYIILTGD